MKKYQIYAWARSFLIVTLIYFVSTPSFAQSVNIDPNNPDTVPGQIQPGQIEQRLQRPPEAQSGGEPIVPVIEEQPQAPEGEDITFILRQVNFEGMTAYDSAAFEDIYGEFIGQEIALSQLFDFAAAITARYRNDGYILSRAIIPPQRIADGVITIQVVEGFIDQITFEGDMKGDQSVLDGYANIIRRSRPLRADQLERFVLLANDLAGASARVVLLPSQDTQGASDLLVILEHDYYEVFTNLDNRGSRYIGPVQASVVGSLNSTFGYYEQLTFRHVTSTQRSELNLYELTYEQPINDNGTKMNLVFSRSFVNPGFDIESIGIVSDSTRVSASVTHPYIRTREENLSFTGGLNLRDSETLILSTQTSEDRVRSLSFNASYDFLDSMKGVNLISPTITKGLDIFHPKRSGEPNLTRTDGRSDFTKFNLDVFRLQSITPSVTMYMAASGQYSLSQLLSSEEFGYGGPQFGRAYDPSEITGDHGVAGQVELRYQRPVDSKILRNYEFYTFLDGGKVWRIDDNSADQSTEDSGVSTGIGTRLSLLDNVSATLEMAVPLTRPVATRSGSDSSKGDDPRYFFSLIARF